VSAPLLVIAVGNPSRGDDALGPRLLDALRTQGVERDGGVELLEEFQLQVEHALDLAGRAAVLFVDASRVPVPDGATVAPVAPRRGHPPASHALLPAALLGVFEQVQGCAPPPAWLLAIEGRSFDLGAGLTPQAAANLGAASRLAEDWIRSRRR
jgi:hydrogenase maturation protease